MPGRETYIYAWQNGRMASGDWWNGEQRKENLQQVRLLFPNKCTVVAGTARTEHTQGDRREAKTYIYIYNT
jgi:hypothetical protein